MLSLKLSAAFTTVFPAEFLLPCFLLLHRNISAIQIPAFVIAVLRDTSSAPERQLLLWTCHAFINDGSVGFIIFLDKEALLPFMLALNCFSNA